MSGTPLRVLHVVGSISPARGGSSAAVWTMLEALRERGVAADLVTTDDDGAGRLDGAALGRFVARDGQRVCMFPRQTSFYAASLPLQRWLQAHVRDYQLVHVHGLFTFAPVVAARAAAHRGVPYVVCPHGVLNRWGRAHNRRLAKRLSLTLLERPILERAACVHFTSDGERAQAADLRLRVADAVVPLALRTTVTATAPQLAPATGAAAPTVLFVGRIDPIKRIDLLLDAFARLPRDLDDARLVVAGTGPATLLEALQARAHALGIAARVRWHGYVDAPTRDRLLAAARVLALTSASENFGLAAAEALAAGVPVVLTPGVGIAPEVEAAGAGLVCAAHADGVATALAAVLRDPALATRMGAAGRRLVAERMTPAALGQGLERLYRAAVPA